LNASGIEIEPSKDESGLLLVHVDRVNEANQSKKANGRTRKTTTERVERRFRDNLVKPVS
jgi:hypothetical protein